MTSKTTLDNAAYWLTLFGTKSATDVVNQHDLRGQSKKDICDFLDAAECGAAEMDAGFRAMAMAGETTADYDAALDALLAAAA